MLEMKDVQAQIDSVVRKPGNRMIGDVGGRTLAIEDVQRLLEQRNRQVVALHEIGRTLATTLDLRDIYWVMYREIAEGLLGASNLVIARFEQETSMISCGFAIIDGEEMDPDQFPPLPLAEGPVSDTIRSRKSSIVDMRERMPQLKAKGEADLIGDERQPLSVLYVPMVSGDRVIGVMNVQHYEPDAFRETDMQLLAILASQAGIAIENAELFSAVQRQNAELEERVAERTRELAEANEQLTELDQLKDQFVSNVSHELRTPLSNIKLYLDLLQHGRPEKAERYMQTLNRETTRLEILIEDILDLSRLDQGASPMELVSSDLNQLASELIADRSAMAVQHDIVLTSQLASDLSFALYDQAKLTQVLINLVDNGINYTPSGTNMEIVTGMRRHENHDWVTLTVQDDGPGIAPDEMLHLFERFFRGKAGLDSGAPGTGLGLAICKEIVDQMGGRLTVQSELGEGAAFTVWLKSVS